MYLIPATMDPLRGVIEWGSTGLLAWLALAAAVGIGLRALRYLSGPGVRNRSPNAAPRDQHFRVAA